MCKISIVMPIYNKKRYIANTVKALLKQTFGDYELLLIDDGSTDGSSEICDQMMLLDSRIKAFHPGKKGVCAARNLGIKKAVGKYICFLDADDCIKKMFLEKLYNAIETNASDMVVCNYFEIKNGKRINRELPANTEDRDHEIYELVKCNMLCVLWNKLFVREKIKHLFDEKMTTCEDGVFCCQYYVDNDAKVTYVDEALYVYIRHKEGITVTLQSNALYGIYKFLDYYIYFVNKIEDEQLRKYATYHMHRIYLFCITTFVFENSSRCIAMNDSIAIISKIINNKKFRRVIKQTLKFSFTEKDIRRLTIKEFAYIILSLLKMKRMVYIFSNLKRFLEPYRLCN